MSEAPLPALHPPRPAWPGEIVEAGGVRLHVRRTPGPATTTAVYVHGLGGSATNWTDLAWLLSGHANGIAVDLPGFGGSEPTPGFSYSLEAHGDALARFLRGLGTGPVHLFGNSMGGAIAMRFAARHPHLVRTLTLVSPAVPDLRPSLGRLSDPRLPLAFLPVVGSVVRRQMAAVPPRERVRQVMRLCYADMSRIPDSRLDEATREYAERATLAWAGPALTLSMVGLVRAWMTPGPRSLWTVARQVTMPSLVIWGAEDKLVSVRKAPRIASLLPHGRLLVLPRTGHVAQMEHPETVARAVLGMWEAAGSGEW